MYIDWVITLSIIIIVLTCVFLVAGVIYSMRKIEQSDPARSSKPSASKC